MQGNELSVERRARQRGRSGHPCRFLHGSLRDAS